MAQAIPYIAMAVSVGSAIYASNQATPDDNAGSNVTKKGSQAGRNRVYGKAMVSCSNVYSNVIDNDSEYRTDIFQVGGVGPLMFHNLFINNKRALINDRDIITDPLNPNSGIFTAGGLALDPYGGFTEIYNSQWLHFQYRSGQENQLAASLTTTSDFSDGEFTDAHRGAGVPQVHIVTKYSNDPGAIIRSDTFSVTVLASGADVFDPRLGSDPESNTSSSSNPALALLDFITNTYYGMGTSFEYIDIPSFRYAAQWCENNSLEMGAEIDAKAPHQDNILDILATFSGAITFRNGLLKVIVEEEVTVTQYSFDESNIMHGTFNVSAGKNNDYYNAISSTYTSSTNNYNDEDYTLPRDLINDEIIKRDGKLKVKDLDLKFIPDEPKFPDGMGPWPAADKQPQQIKFICNRELIRSQFLGTCSFDVDLLEYPDLEVWSVIDVSNDIHQFTNKKYRVQSIISSTNDEKFNVAEIHCVEYDDSIYNGTYNGSNSSKTYPPIKQLKSPNFLNFNLLSFTNAGKGDLTWIHTKTSTSTKYQVEYRLSYDYPDPIPDPPWEPTFDPYVRAGETDELIYTFTNLKNDNYDFRVRTYDYIRGYSDWVQLLSVPVVPDYTVPKPTNLGVVNVASDFLVVWDDVRSSRLIGGNLPTSDDNPDSGYADGTLGQVFKHFMVEVYDPTIPDPIPTGYEYAPLKTYFTQDPTFTYTFEENVANGLLRSVDIKVTSVTNEDVKSITSEISTNNVQISKPVGFSVTNVNGNSTLEWDPRAEKDFAGTAIYVSDTEGFIPDDSTLLTELQAESFYVYNFDPDDTTDRFVKIAHFDSFDSANLNFSDEKKLSYLGGALDAKVVTLTSTSPIFKFKADGTLISPASITFTADRQNITDHIGWEINPPSAGTGARTGNDVFVMTAADFGSNDTVTVTARADNLFDTITIFGLKDGSNGVGADGSDGVDGSNGTSIVWKGNFAGHPTNPLNGWAYKNTLDGKSYVYQDGTWYQMTVDGVDGTDGMNGSDGLDIVWKGDLSSPPANPVKNWVYRDTDNGYVYIYNGTAWELMVLDGSDGTDGTNGSDGWSIYITYHDNDITTTPATPTGDGTSNGWTTTPSASSNWMSQKVAPSVNSGTWGDPILITGDSGDGGLSVILTNSSHTIPTDYEGNNGDYSGSSTELHIFEGAEALLYDGSGNADGTWRVALTSHNIGHGYFLDSGGFITTSGASSMTGDTAYINFAITGKTLSGESFSLSSRQTFSKSKSGNDGSSAKDISLVADSQILVVDQYGTPNPSSTGITATTQNVSGVITWVTEPTGITLSGSGNTKILHYNSFGSNDFISVIASINGVSDRITIYAVKDGVDGATGANGASGVDGTDGTSIVWRGSSSSHPINPMNGWAYKNTSDGKSYVYQDGTWYQMTVDGVDGSNGVNGTDGLPIVWKGDLPSPPANPVKNWTYRDTDNGYVYIYNGTAWELMVLDGSDGTDGANGSDGHSVFITYHSNPIDVTPATPTGDGTSNGWTTTPSASSNWMSQKVAEYASHGTWGNPISFSGEDGLNAISVILSNESHTIPTDSDGGSGNYTNSGTDVHVFEGANALVYDGVGSAAGRWKVERTAYGISRGTLSDAGDYAISGNSSNMTADTAYIDMRVRGRMANGDYFDITKRQTYSKSKSGSDGGTGNDGNQGDHGPGSVYFVGANPVWNSQINGDYNTALGLPTNTPVGQGALISYVDSLNGDSATRRQDWLKNSSGSWTRIKAVVNGNQIIYGTLAAHHLQANTITGSKISASTTIIAGSGSYSAGMNGWDSGNNSNYANWRFWAGAQYPASAPFRINYAGELWATNANITGDIVTNRGRVNSILTVGPDGDDYVGLYGGGTGNQTRIWAGSNNASSAPFRVYHDGSLYASKATINATINGGSINIGSGKFTVDTSGYFRLPMGTSGSFESTNISNEGGFGYMTIRNSANVATAYFRSSGSVMYAPRTSISAAISVASVNGNAYAQDGIRATGNKNGGVFTSTGTGQSSGIAVRGTANGSSGIGMFGEGKSYGMYGRATNSTSYGVRGEGKSYDFYAGGTGSNYGPFTGSHEGIVSENHGLTEGDIICDIDVINIRNLSNAICLMGISAKPNQRAVRGVYLTSIDNHTPVAFEGSEFDMEDKEFITFNAVGEGVMNVCGEGGDMEVGDLIASSSTPGKGMKQEDQSVERPYTIAQIRHPVTFDDPKEIKQVAVIYLRG